MYNTSKKFRRGLKPPQASILATPLDSFKKKVGNLYERKSSSIKSSLQALMNKFIYFKWKIIILYKRFRILFNKEKILSKSPIKRVTWSENIDAGENLIIVKKNSFKNCDVLGVLYGDTFKLPNKSFPHLIKCVASASRNLWKNSLSNH